MQTGVIELGLTEMTFAQQIFCCCEGHIQLLIAKLILFK